MLPILLLSSLLATTVVAGSSDDYSLPDGFDLNQIKTTERCIFSVPFCHAILRADPS